MSSGERWAIFIGVLGLILMAIQDWVLLSHEQWRTAGLVKSVGIVLFSLLVIGVNVYAISRNLRDSHRAENLRSEIVTIKDEFNFQLDQLSREHKAQLDKLIPKGTNAL